MEGMKEYEGVNEISCEVNNNNTFDCKLYSVEPDRERTFIAEENGVINIATEADRGITYAVDKVFVGFYTFEDSKCIVIPTADRKIITCSKIEIC